jgi:biotin carboxyl carrier protein
MRVGTGVKVKETVKAPMPGLVVKVITEIGAVVKKGDPLVVVEAMKMENEIKSSVEGKVTDIKVKEKQAVEKNETLVVIEGI